MKRFIALLLPFSALAEMDERGNVVVRLPGAHFAFTPNEGYCLTRESSASAFNRLGMSQRDTVDYMQAYDLYAMLYDADFTEEIQVAAWESDAQDFDELTSFGAEAMVKAIRSEYEGQGWQVHSVELYRSPEGLLSSSASAPVCMRTASLTASPNT